MASIATKQTRKPVFIIQLDPKTANLILLIVNAAFIVFAYQQSNKLYQNEDDYQGSMSMLYNYFRETRDSINNTDTGRTQYATQMMAHYLLPLIGFILIQGWITSATEKAMISSFITNMLVILVIGGMIALVNNMIRNNHWLPNKWLIKRDFYKAATSDVYRDLLSQTMHTNTNAWSEADYRSLLRLNQSQQPSAPDSFANDRQGTITSLLDLLDRNNAFNQPTEHDLQMSYAIALNDAELIMDVLKQEWNEKSDTQKHQEYIKEKRRNDRIFIIMTIVLLTPNVISIIA